MGIENERIAALSIESIPKSISEVQMELSSEAGVSGESVEPLQRQSLQKAAEKNGL